MRGRLGALRCTPPSGLRDFCAGRPVLRSAAGMVVKRVPTQTQTRGSPVEASLSLSSPYLVKILYPHFLEDSLRMLHLSPTHLKQHDSAESLLLLISFHSLSSGTVCKCGSACPWGMLRFSVHPRPRLTPGALSLLGSCL